MNDFSARPARILKGDEVLATGKYRYRLVHTPTCASPTKKGPRHKKRTRATYLVLKCELLPLTSHLRLAQAMPITGVPRITVALGQKQDAELPYSQDDARVEIQQTNNSHSSAAGISAAKHFAYFRQSIPAQITK